MVLLMPVSQGPAIMPSDYTRNLTGARVPFPGTAGGTLRVGRFSVALPGDCGHCRTVRPGPGLRCPGRPAPGQARGLHRAAGSLLRTRQTALAPFGRHRVQEQDLAAKRLTGAPSRHGSNSRREGAAVDMGPRPARQGRALDRPATPVARPRGAGRAVARAGLAGCQWARDRAACSIRRATASGWETATAWDAFTSTVRAWARSAMNCWAAGGML